MKKICFMLFLVVLVMAKRPYIVVILVDDMGYSDLGSYGGEIDTPNLDKLAKKGKRFTQFYNTSRCCPSRASLLTGLYPHQTGVGFMVYKNYGKDGYRKNLNDKNVTFAELLKKSGYQTMMVGKWHVGHTDSKARPEVRGFDKFTGIYSHVDSYWKVLHGSDIYRDGKLFIKAQSNPVNPYRPNEEFYTTDFFTDVSLDYIDGVKNKDKPFLLYLAYNVPHFPLETPENLIEKYRGKYKKGWDILRKEKLQKMKQQGVVNQNQKLPKVKSYRNAPIKGFIQDGDKNSVPLPKWENLSAKQKDELDFRRAMYAGQIDNLDQNIGRIVQKLKNLNLYENTLILFMSDNGCSGESGLFGMNWSRYKSSNYKEWRKKGGWSISQGMAWAAYSNTPFKKYKRFVHEGGISSPLIAHWPKKIKNPSIVKDNYFHFIDVLPTLCEIAKIPYPSNFKGKKITPVVGKSFLSYLTDQKENTISKDRPMFWQHSNKSAVRMGKWKLVTMNDRSKKLCDWKLFDIERDRAEENNLAEQYPKLVEKMKKIWLDWAKNSNVLPFPES